MERWDFLFSEVSSPIVYFLSTTNAVCPNINPIMLCAHVCDVNYAACYGEYGEIWSKNGKYWRFVEQNKAIKDTIQQSSW